MAGSCYANRRKGPNKSGDGMKTGQGKKGRKAENDMVGRSYKGFERYED